MLGPMIIRELAPWLLIAWGGLLTLKPNIFVRGHWKQTDIAQRLLSPTAYLVYTRTLGLFSILFGFVWLVLIYGGEPRGPHKESPRRQIAQIDQSSPLRDENRL